MEQMMRERWGKVPWMHYLRACEGESIKTWINHWSNKSPTGPFNGPCFNSSSKPVFFLGVCWKVSLSFSKNWTHYNNMSPTQEEGNIAWNFLTQEFNMERAMQLVVSCVAPATTIHPHPHAQGHLQSWQIATTKPSCWQGFVTLMVLRFLIFMKPWKGASG